MNVVASSTSHTVRFVRHVAEQEYLAHVMAQEVKNYSTEIMLSIDI